MRAQHNNVRIKISPCRQVVKNFLLTLLLQKVQIFYGIHIHTDMRLVRRIFEQPVYELIFNKLLGILFSGDINYRISVKSF
jgi:hypothetical protein